MKYILGFIAVLVLIVAGAVFYSSNIISTAITTAGSEALGVPVRVKSVDIGFLKGEARIQGLSIANPEGYTTTNAISLGEVYVKLEPKSLMSDKIVIEKILVSAPEIFYEGSLKGSNFKTIQNNLKARQPAKEAKKASDTTGTSTSKEQVSTSPSKKLQIDVITIEKAAMHMLAKTPAGDKEMDVTMPKIEIKGIGSKGTGASVEEAIQTVVAPFLTQIQSGAINALKEGGLNEAVQQLKSKGGDMVDKLKNLF